MYENMKHNLVQYSSFQLIIVDFTTLDDEMRWGVWRQDLSSRTSEGSLLLSMFKFRNLILNTHHEDHNDVVHTKSTTEMNSIQFVVLLDENIVYKLVHLK